jgi:hypothetical protein
VTSHCGDAEGVGFSNHYENRSGLLHRGERIPEKDLGQRVRRLGATVRRLIVSHIAASLKLTGTSISS